MEETEVWNSQKRPREIQDAMIKLEKEANEHRKQMLDINTSIIELRSTTLKEVGNIFYGLETGIAMISKNGFKN